MTGKCEHQASGRKREFGQGMLEFALVLPALLLTLMGIADFGRLFAVYSSLFNAAREGARHGVVNPKDVVGITAAARDKINLVEAGEVDIFVHFDSGPGTAIKNFDSVTIGDRVIVTLKTDVDLITPLIRAITKQLHVETAATRTIATLGDSISGDYIPAPPTFTPAPTSTPGPTPTMFELNTATPDGGLPDSKPGFTPTPVIPPILIDNPLMEGDMEVTGTAMPGASIQLRNIQTGLVLETTVSLNGTFRFDLPGPLIGAQVIAVLGLEGYNSIDYAIVLPAITPTPTPRPTQTLTPTPVGSYIDITPICGPQGSNTITVIGHQWPTNEGPLYVQFDENDVITVTATSDFAVDITVDVPDPGEHTVTVLTYPRFYLYQDSKTFTVPCPPTPTPSLPNLVVESIALGSGGTISTYDPLTFTVAVRNIGSAAATGLFWVDLFADPAVEPPAPADLLIDDSLAWAAVSSLLPSESTSLTLNYFDGFTTTGDHRAYALVDSWDQVWESVEGDNVGGPLTVNVGGTLLLPTPTPGTVQLPTPTPGTVELPTSTPGTVELPTSTPGTVELPTSTPGTVELPTSTPGTVQLPTSTPGTVQLPTPTSGTVLLPSGTISGTTYLLLGTVVMPVGRVDVSLWEDSVLVAETMSDQNGDFSFQYLPAGIYTVIGAIYVDDVLYTDIVSNVEIEDGTLQIPKQVSLILH